MTLTNFNLGRAACTSCHGDSGEGTPLGPDLTGKKWLWSDGSYSGVKKTITEGVSQQNNIAAPCRRSPMGGAQLTPDQISALAAYVWA
jgi:mono/diheme cytochrome c family protein